MIIITCLELEDRLSHNYQKRESKKSPTGDFFDSKVFFIRQEKLNIAE